MREIFEYIAIIFWLALITFGAYLAIVMVSERLEAKAEQTDISTNDDLRHSVEENLRSMISLWESDLELYNETDDPTRPDIWAIHLRTKARMDETANAYNAYLQRYQYLFPDTLPDDIYAAIERTE